MLCCIVLFSSKVMSSCNFGLHNATLFSYFAEPLNESSVGIFPVYTKQVLFSNFSLNVNCCIVDSQDKKKQFGCFICRLADTVFFLINITIIIELKQ